MSMSVKKERVSSKARSVHPLDGIPGGRKKFSNPTADT